MDLQDLQYFQSRREFFRNACAAVGTLSIAATIRDLRFINTAAAATTNIPGYKALVCIFMSGGNDSNNIIIPVGGEYPNYAAVRQNLALPESAVLPISPLNPDGHTYGLHPKLDKLQTLFGEGKAAMLFNVGPLVYPLTRAQYSANSVPKPPQLFSHSDQVTHWQTSLPDQPPKAGWGGRIADLLHPLQYQLNDGIPTVNSAKIALCTSIAGSNTFEVGNTVAQYHVSTSGAVTVSGVSGTRLQAMQDLLALQDVNLQRTAFADVTQNALDTGNLLNSAISGSSASNFFTTPFPATSIGNQLKMVARLIHGRTAMDMKRQIFFVSTGGFDTHNSQIGNDANGNPDSTLGSHANLLDGIDEAIYAFQRAMEQPAVNAANDVTAFTMSDFARTFRANSTDGSDHAWGSHQIIVGGAVNGKKTYGILPVLQTNGPDAVPSSAEGRWIPTIAVDQYAATLARWFGVDESDLSVIFPNIGRFASSNLGFLPTLSP